VILERSLDDLVKQVRGYHLVNVGTRKIASKWLMKQRWVNSEQAETDQY
jgi:hypothetical protein